MLNTKLLINTNIHREAVNWHNMVLTNGGGVRKDTLKAVSDFCYRIDAAGIRDKFLRLNLFCGNNLKACVVPLYTNTSMNYTPVGNAVDTNNSFVDGDYSASTGLTSDGSKSLLTGLSTLSSCGGDSPRLNGHMSAYVRRPYDSNTYGYNNNIMGNVRGLINNDPEFDYYNGYMLSLDYYSGQVSISPGVLFGYDSGIQGSWATVSNTNNTLPTSFIQGFFLGTSQYTGNVNSGAYIYRNNVDVTESVNLGAGTTVDVSDIAIFTLYSNASSNNPLEAPSAYDGSLGSYSLGKYMTPTQALNYYTILQAFQTAMGRQV